jgi:hypothetical protein
MAEEVKSVVDQKLDEVYAQMEEPAKPIYSLDDAVTAAKKELGEMFLRGDIVSPQIYLLGARHAPHTMDEISYAMSVHTWVLGVPPEPGRLLLDVIKATFAKFISDALFMYQRELVESRLNTHMEARASEQLKERRYGTSKPIPKKKKTAS